MKGERESTSKSKSITLTDIKGDRRLVLNVSVEEGSPGLFSNVSLKQFGLSSRGVPAQHGSKTDDDLEAHLIDKGDTVVSDDLDAKSFRARKGETTQQQLHAKVGFTSGMTAQVHALCADDKVRVLVESSESEWAGDITLQATGTLLNQAGEVLDSHRTVVQSTMPGTQALGTLTCRPAMRTFCRIKLFLAAMIISFFLMMIIAKAVTHVWKH